jgi:hypothetical protein
MLWEWFENKQRENVEEGFKYENKKTKNLRKDQD